MSRCSPISCAPRPLQATMCETDVPGEGVDTPLLESAAGAWSDPPERAARSAQIIGRTTSMKIRVQQLFACRLMGEAWDRDGIQAVHGRFALEQRIEEIAFRDLASRRIRDDEVTRVGRISKSMARGYWAWWSRRMPRGSRIPVSIIGNRLLRGLHDRGVNGYEGFADGIGRNSLRYKNLVALIDRHFARRIVERGPSKEEALIVLSLDIRAGAMQITEYEGLAIGRM